MPLIPAFFMLKFALMLAGTSPYLHLKPHLVPLLLLLLLLSLQIFASAPSDPDAASHRISLRRSAIKQRLSSLSSNADKLAALQDSYSGRTHTPSPKPCPSLSQQNAASRHRSRSTHEAFPGETCFIVACGPSLANMSSPRLRAAVAGGVVFAVKQASQIQPAFPLHYE